MRIVLMALMASGCLAQAAAAQTHCSKSRSSVHRVHQPVASVHCVKASTVSGLEWTSRAIRADDQRPNQRASRSPGPGYYGAAQDDCSVIHVRVGFETATIDPWTRINRGEAPAHFEQARQRWLKDNGYVGSVRTFTNPAPTDEVEGEVQEIQGAKGPGVKGMPQPRAIIQIREGTRRKAPRFEVNAKPVRIMVPHTSQMAAHAWAGQINEQAVSGTPLAVAQR